MGYDRYKDETKKKSTNYQPNYGEHGYAPLEPNPSEGCVPCTVFKPPGPICPGANFTLDVPFLMQGQIFGGDNLLFPGEPGCANVRHEIRAWAPGTEAAGTGELLDSWEETVLVDAPVSRLVTLTTAQWNALGDPFPFVSFGIVSYTCDDFASNFDFCQMTPNP